MADPIDETETEQAKLAEWTSGYINDLPDSAFLYISPGGEEDDVGKTKPRSLRHLPYRDSKGDVDLPHLRSAISQMPKSTAPGLTKEKMRDLQDKAREMLRKATEDMAEPEEDEKPKGDDPFGGEAAPPFKKEMAAPETEEERKAREDEEAKAKAKGGALEYDPKRSRGGYGNPANRRYAAEGYWSAPLLLSEGPESWVEVVRSGTFYGNTGPKPRKIELTSGDVYAMARNYEVVLAEQWFAGGAPVGYNHALAAGNMDPGSTKAAARIKQVEVRPNDKGGVSLWGLFSWTDEGAQRVGAKEFAGISAELIPPTAATSKQTGQPLGGWTVVGATLTNQPFVPSMARPTIFSDCAMQGNDPSVTLAATDPTPSRIHLCEGAEAQQEITPMTDILVKLAEATGLPTEAPELLAEVRRLQTEADKVTVLTETLETATKEVEGLRDRNSILEEREKVRTLDSACTIGRIAPAEREDYWQVCQTLGEEKANRIFAEGRLPVGRETTEADAPATGTHASAIEAEVEALAEKIQKDTNLTEAAAYSRAMSTVLADPTKLAAYEAESLDQ